MLDLGKRIYIKVEEIRKTSASANNVVVFIKSVHVGSMKVYNYNYNAAKEGSSCSTSVSPPSDAAASEGVCVCCMYTIYKYYQQQKIK